MALNCAEGVFMAKTAPTNNTEMVSLKKASTNTGKVEIVRPSALATSGKTGVVAEGIFEGAKPNKFNADKNDYFIRGSDDTLYILNSTQSLADQLGQPGLEGMKVRVEYGGKVKTKNGKSFHDFNVFAETKKA